MRGTETTLCTPLLPLPPNVMISTSPKVQEASSASRFHHPRDQMQRFRRHKQECDFISMRLRESRILCCNQFNGLVINVHYRLCSLAGPEGELSASANAVGSGAPPTARTNIVAATRRRPSTPARRRRSTPATTLGSSSARAPAHGRKRPTSRGEIRDFFS